MVSVSFVGLMEAGQLFGWDRLLRASLKTNDNKVEVVWRWYAKECIAKKPAELDGKPAKGGGDGGGGDGGEGSGGGGGGGKERRRWGRR